MAFTDRRRNRSDCDVGARWGAFRRIHLLPASCTRCIALDRRCFLLGILPSSPHSNQLTRLDERRVQAIRLEGLLLPACRGTAWLTVIRRPPINCPFNFLTASSACGASARLAKQKPR